MTSNLASWYVHNILKACLVCSDNICFIQLKPQAYQRLVIKTLQLFCGTAK